MKKETVTVIKGSIRKEHWVRLYSYWKLLHLSYLNISATRIQFFVFRLGKDKCQVVAQHLRAVSLTHTTTENIKMKVKGKE